MLYKPQEIRNNFNNIIKWRAYEYAIIHLVFLMIMFIVLISKLSFQNFSVSLIKGFIDSLRGVTVLLYLDKEINERALSRSPKIDETSKQKGPNVQQ